MGKRWNKILCSPAGVVLLAAVLIFLDRLTKIWAVARLKDQEPLVIWDGVFELHYLENRGAAFGMLQGQRILFLVIGVAVLVIGVYLFRHMSSDERFWPIRLIAVAILSGAVGNMIDRVVNAYVVDFFYFKLIDFPIFNVADIYVSVGTCVLVVLILFYYKDEELNRLLVKKEKK